MNRRDFLTSSACALSVASVPGMLRPAWGLSDGFIELAASPTDLDLLGDPEKPTPVWSYNNSVPGPVIRVRKGERVKARLINRLEQPTSIHWHGIRIDNAMDGVVGLTQDAVAPGETFDYDFVAPDAGSYWYHSHNRSWEQVARGLYGTLIVEEDTAPAFDRDIIFVVDDWRLAPTGLIDEASFDSMHDRSHNGRLGNWLTVNSRSRPVFDVGAGEQVRVRVMNTANARVLNIDFAPLGASVIALDGMAVNPRPLSGPLRMSPGQRVDLAFAAKGQADGAMIISEVSSSTAFPFASFAVNGAQASDISSGKPVVSLEIPSAPRLDLGSALRQDLLMEGGAMGGMRGATVGGEQLSMRALVDQGLVWAFNGIAGDMTEPFFTIQKGRTAVIDMINDTAFSHAMHLHGQHFKIVERDGKPVDGDWRDTELLEPGERVAVAFVADNPGKWLFHCHMLEHQVSGMRTWIHVKA